MRMSALIGLAMMALFLPHTVSADPVDDYLHAQMQKQRIPGLAVAVLREGKVVKQQGYGLANLEWDAPADAHTAFQLASATKLFTGIAVMRLVEQGKLDLDDSVSKYVSDLPESWHPITLRHLVAHQSGIPDALKLNRPIATPRDAIQAAAELPLEFAPGEKTAYASADYSLLMLILEQVTGKPFPALLKDEILTPVGSSSTTFNDARDEGSVRQSRPIQRRATVYFADSGGQQINDFLFPSWTYAAGGLYSTASDLARVFAALHDGSLLKPASVSEMWTAQATRDGSPGTFGIGWAVGKYRGHKTVGHSGGPALADVLHFVDERLTVIVLTNQQNLYPYLAQGVADHYLPAPEAATAKAIVDPEPATTENLKNVIVDAAQGNIREDAFTAQAQKQFVPALRQFGPQFFRTLEPLSSFVLIERHAENDQVRLSYAALYGSKPIRWTFTLDKTGKIMAMEPKQE